MKTHRSYLQSVAFWSPLLTDWEQARVAFRDNSEPPTEIAKRPSPELLAPTERRRAPDTVAIALEVASRAVALSGHAAQDLPSVFASTHGDLAINDYMCSTLAESPTSISPTKFHNSVHNAAAGYWTIGSGCRQASTALTAFDHSFAHGLLEALSQSAANAQPVLLVAYDIAACGGLASVTSSRGMLATALVLSPTPGNADLGYLDWSLGDALTAEPATLSRAAQAHRDNAMADCLPFLQALASNQPKITLPLGRSLALNLHWESRHD